MRRRLAGLAGAVCGLSLVVGCTSDAVDPAGLGRPYGPQPEDSAPAWPANAGVELAGQPSRWWPVASARDLSPTGIDVVVASDGVEGMVVDGAGTVWVDMPWGLARLDPATGSASTWNAGDDAAFVSNWFLRASVVSGVWLVEQDRARLFDGDRFVRDIQVPPAYLEAGEDEEGMPWREGIRDLVEVGFELWIASEAGVARCDGHTCGSNLVSRGVCACGAPRAVRRHQPGSAASCRSSHLTIAWLVSSGFSCWIQWPQSRLTSSALGTNVLRFGDRGIMSRSP